MIDSRLLVFFQQLDVKYHKILSKAVESPFFNTRIDVVQLWKILVEQTNEPLQKEKIFGLLYPNTVFDAQKLNIVMNKLLDMIERVVIITDFEEDEIEQKLRLMQLTRKMGLEPHFNTANKEIAALLVKNAKKDSQFYQQSYQLEIETYAFNIANRTSELNLQRLNDTLDWSYMVEKLKQNCILLSHQAVYKKEYDAGLLDAVLERIASQPKLLEEHPALRIYYYCYLSLKNPAQLVYFEYFKADLLAHFSLFGETDIRDLYLLAINYCIKKNNSGDVDYARQGLELYKTALKQGFLLENNILSRFTYHNIVAWALLEKDFEWAESFIQTYRNRLERTYRDSMYSFCLAKLEYSRQHYQAVMMLLQKAEYRDTLLALAAKTILLKTYFELDEYDALDAHLSSMRAYLKRKRVLGYHKTNYLNIINYTQKMVQYFGNDKKINDLQQAVLAEDILTEKEWLLENLRGMS